MPTIVLRTVPRSRATLLSRLALRWPRRRARPVVLSPHLARDVGLDRVPDALPRRPF